MQPTHLDKITEERDEDEGERHAEEDGGRDESRPVDGLVVTEPPQHEDTDNEEGSAEHGAIQSLLGGRVTVPSRDQNAVVSLHDDVDYGPESGSNTNTDEHESSLARVEATKLNEDERENREQRVEESIAVQGAGQYWTAPRTKPITHMTER